METGYFLKVPKVLFSLGRYDDRFGKEIQPRHVLLLLAIAARQFQSQETRFFWEDLAKNLGTKRETIRKWAYEARSLGLLKIKRHRGRRDPEKDKPGIKNDRNGFDIAGFVAIVAAAERERMAGKAKRKRASAGGVEP